MNDGVARAGSESLRSQIPRFALVGVVATLVHYGVAVALMRHAEVTPNLANVMGWLAAVGTSFWGHLKLTFNRPGVDVLGAGIRFFALSSSLFALNAVSYALLLRADTTSHEIGLAAVLLGQAMLSFAASRAWAFRRRQ